jgi:hypothetical protein
MRTFTALVRFSLPDRDEHTAADHAEEFHLVLGTRLKAADYVIDEVQAIETTGQVLVPAIALLSELAVQRDKIASMESLARARGRR